MRSRAWKSTFLVKKAFLNWHITTTREREETSIMGSQIFIKWNWNLNMDFGILFFFLDFDRYHNLKVSYRVVLIFTMWGLRFREIKHKNFLNGKSKTGRRFPNKKLNPNRKAKTYFPNRHGQTSRLGSGANLSSIQSSNEKRKGLPLEKLLIFPNY